MIVLTWDWKESPDWDKLNKELENWKGPIVFNEVDTKTDSYAVIVSHGPMSDEEIHTVWRNYCRS